MRLIFSLLASPCLLVSCIPEGSVTQVTPGATMQTSNASSSSLVDDRLRTQGDRIGRLETELHEMRLLFTNQLTRIEEVANRTGALPANGYQPQASTQAPQQVVIMPNSPVVTHRWDQEAEQQPQQQQRPGPSNQTRGYSIRSGDTISQIAEAYGISSSALLTANPGTDPLRLRIGKRLTIPSASQAAQLTARTQSRARNYTVQPGDTLSQIAERHGIRLSELMAANPGIEPTHMRVGKQLNIPSRVSYPNTNQQPTGYASPPLRSIQRQPQSIPQTQLQPQYKSAPALPAQTEPTYKVLIKIPTNTSFGEIAEKVGTDVHTLNQLNHCALSASSRIPANGTLYVPSSTPANVGQ